MNYQEELGHEEMRALFPHAMKVFEIMTTSSRREDWHFYVKDDKLYMHQCSNDQNPVEDWVWHDKAWHSCFQLDFHEGKPNV